jgi:hypothetical protein
VSLDTERPLVSVLNILWIPVCIAKDTTPGTWTITIRTDVASAGILQSEMMEADFEVR